MSHSDPITYWEVHFNDEAPAFGAGHRRVLMVAEGTRWAHLLAPEDCTAEKLELKIFERMKPVELLMPRWNYQEMAVRLKRIAKEYNRYSSAYFLAMEKLGDPQPRPELTAEQKLARAKLQESKPPKVYVPGEGEKPGQNEGSGKLMMRLWMTGNYTPEQLVQVVLTNWPGRTTKKSDVYYNYKILERMEPAERLKLYGREDLPAWPKKEAK